VAQAHLTREQVQLDNTFQALGRTSEAATLFEFSAGDSLQHIAILSPVTTGLCSEHSPTDGQALINTEERTVSKTPLVQSSGEKLSRCS
jgi:hypothetical protein